MSSLENLPVDIHELNQQEKEIISLLFQDEAIEKKDEDPPKLLPTQQPPSSSSSVPVQEQCIFSSSSHPSIKDATKTLRHPCIILFEEGMIIVALFLLFGAKYTEDMIMKLLPFSKKSVWCLLCIKIILILVVFWVIRKYI